MTGEFTELIDLASERVGGAVLLANDEFFAPKENLLRAEAPIFIEEKYTERGKWMDGWETRRRRSPGHDFCVIRLGVPGVVRGAIVDTSFFRGNYPAECALAVCEIAGYPPSQSLESAPWQEILGKSPLKGDTLNRFPIEASARATHVRLSIFPDGGVAQLRLYGEVFADFGRLARRGEFDLAAVEHGGRVIACSDMFFGSRGNLIMPGFSKNMGDGWETKRRRGEGHDWATVALATRGTIRRVEVDTSHFKGNAPDRCRIEVADGSADSWQSATWRTLLPDTKLLPDTRHFFEDELANVGPSTLARLSVFPDGGVARLRLFGNVGAAA